MTEDPIDLTPRLLAIARGRGCDLLGMTILHGVRTELVDALRIFPGLTDHLSAHSDPDATAAEHHRVLHRGVRPMESLFLSADGLIGGPISSQVGQRMRADGLAISPAEAPDHLGQQIAWISHLLGAEADARADERHDLLEPIRSCQRQALDLHILRYLLPLWEATTQLQSPLYAALLDTALQLLVDLRDSLDEEPEFWVLPSPPKTLTHPSHRLRDMAQWLCTPSWSGVYLSLSLIQKWGRQLDIPSGFGRRSDCLENLLHGAVRYDRLEALVSMMGAEFDTMVRVRAESPLHPTHRNPWNQRLRATREGLCEISDAVRTEAMVDDA